MIFIEVFYSIVIYLSVGCTLFVPRLISEEGMNDILAVCLVVVYVFLGVGLAYMFLSPHLRKQNVFDRAYYFSGKPYSIDSHGISLYAKSRASKRFEDISLLKNAIAEYYHQSNGMHDFHASGAYLPLKIDSDAEVHFAIHVCTKYPFTHIDLSQLRITYPNAISLELHDNPFIQKIIFPKTLQSLYIDIRNCPNLKTLILPGSNNLEISPFDGDLCPIKHVHPEFSIEVLELRLSDYQRKYRHISVRFDNETTLPLRFSAL